LIESQLFGHVKGAFTGATSDRTGLLGFPCELASTTPDGQHDSYSSPLTIFLDEIGELSLDIQVKLLSVLQNRSFYRVGDFECERPFHGKIVAATNRNLGRAMQSGEFREDFYYRLCADTIESPSLSEQLKECPDDIDILTRYIAAERVLKGLPEEAERLATSAVAWIKARLPSDYAWPGNIRELEQCVRSILVRGSYQPPRWPAARSHPFPQEVTQRFLAGQLTAAEVQRHYYSLVRAQTASRKAAAERLQVDARTLDRWVDNQLVASYRRA
jgi:transcriptional regulator with PAS, ATPase and Fis domain